ncbi:hypothetical protein Lesp02_36150 [Lentzea sp. NBRC 105346]|uniref:hypothetical protein n=1 Tax=Lentzea sp. NBRC 105346 TaxID=3032205 RepID=UPI0024A2A23B|nr:hypothetical protein [Lentzea sp. NBRC 105346]GLZ31427.1 hypothetical protein Lesp02_36150 [Lentzea sp. NBRC 105346]
MADRRLGVLAALALVAGCGAPVQGTARPVELTDGDRSMIKAFYDDLNKAGDEGSSSQQDLIKDTQHPDFRAKTCDLKGATLKIEPTWSTLRMDADWAPPGQKEHPRGVVYVVAVTVSLRQEKTVIGSQIGSQHVVLLDGKAYGFAPCAGG